MIDDRFRNLCEKPVYIGKHVIIGTNSTILPGVTISEGCAFGACSLILEDCDEWGIYVGVPVRRYKERIKDLLNYECLIN
nr:hypothetical protein [Clostridium yunnanense]